jgi:hypothetical protein
MLIDLRSSSPRRLFRSRRAEGRCSAIVDISEVSLFGAVKDGLLRRDEELEDSAYGQLTLPFGEWTLLAAFLLYSF